MTEPEGAAPPSYALNVNPVQRPRSPELPGATFISGQPASPLSFHFGNTYPSLSREPVQWKRSTPIPSISNDQHEQTVDRLALLQHPPQQRGYPLAHFSLPQQHLQPTPQRHPQHPHLQQPFQQQHLQQPLFPYQHQFQPLQHSSSQRIPQLPQELPEHLHIHQQQQQQQQVQQQHHQIQQHYQIQHHHQIQQHQLQQHHQIQQQQLQLVQNQFIPQLLDTNELLPQSPLATTPLSTYSQNPSLPTEKSTSPKLPETGLLHLPKHNNRSAVSSTHKRSRMVTLTPDFLTMRQSEAAAKLGMATSTFSKRWRESLQERKWPYRKNKKIDNKIAQLLLDKIKGRDVEFEMLKLVKEKEQNLQPASIVFNDADITKE